MAKSPGKVAAKPAGKTATAAPKAALPKTPRKAVSAKIATIAPAPKNTGKTAKPAKTAALKPKAAAKAALKETSSRISQLASDILTDRIVPTIEQIKAIAASALGQDETKGGKGKGKGKKKK
ncbi:MAG: hypothetical protein P0Y59_04240 [Candidatus Sphingomonas phytovorans]|nr:hypothetical protein [Sphingomonas sp.]WEK00912.1 MAG: hypothetical protein P0Y59_04240 [Sphingomonas sp.]